MRAMLALGASHLSITTDADLNSQALAHRVEAVNLLNKALARPAISKDEADARFAAFMILTFQSSCMADGIFDFLTMLRGCMFHGKYVRLTKSAFSAFVGESSHLSKMEERFTDAQLETLDTKTLGEAVASLTALLPLCETEVELRYHTLLTNIVTYAYTSPKAGRYLTVFKMFPAHSSQLMYRSSNYTMSLAWFHTPIFSAWSIDPMESLNFF